MIFKAINLCFKHYNLIMSARNHLTCCKIFTAGFPDDGVSGHHWSSS